MEWWPFHRRASQRHKKNTIEGMHDTNGVWCTNTGEIAIIAEAYYKDLFTASTDLSMEGVLASVDNVVTKEMVRSLTHSYTEEEVRVALFQMHHQTVCLLSFSKNSGTLWGTMS